MMVNCPKCGFSQPEDQYCASCGVDMVAYRPAQKSFLRRMASNTVFQMATVSLAIFIVFVIVREQNHKNHMARLELARQSERFAEQREARRAKVQAEAAQREQITEASTAIQELPAADTPSEPPSSFVPPQPKGIAPPVAAPNPQLAGAPGAVASPARPGSQAAAAAAAKPADSVRITFIEAQRPLINELMTGASQVVIAGNISIGVIPNVQARLQSSKGGGWRTLESSSFQTLKANQPNMLFKGLRDATSGANLGFTVQVIPGVGDEQGTFLQVDILRVLRDAGTGVDELTFPLPDGFTVPKGGAVVIAGVLPHRQLHEGEERAYSGASVLRVMATEAFRSGSTDAVILVETR